METFNRVKLLDYARSHGLASTQALHEDVDATAFLPSMQEVETKLADPEDAVRVSDFDDFNQKEKLAIDGPARALVQSMFSMQDGESHFFVNEFDPRRTAKLRLGEPMLRTDNETDVKNFRKSGERANRLRITCKLVEVDDENDEGLQWPSECLELPNHYTKVTRAEKLEIPIEALEFLKNTSFVVDEISDHEALVKDEINYRKNPALDPATPPLFPLMPMGESHKPSSPLLELNLFPEPANVTSDELHSVEKRISASERVGPSDGRCSSLQKDENPAMLVSGFPSFSSSIGMQSSPPLPKARDLKVEVPMTPPMTTPQQRSVSFSDLIGQIPLVETGHDRAASDEEYEAFFNDVVEPSAMRIEHELQHEKLQEADSTKRVPVPSLDFNIPKPPWKRAPFVEDDGLDFGALLLPISRMKLHHWPGKQKIDVDVRWTPLPRELATVATNESLGNDEAMLSLIDPAQYAGNVDVDSLTWKPDGCRVLDYTHDDDDEIEVAAFGHDDGLDALVRKRKSDLGQTHPPFKAVSPEGRSAGEGGSEVEEMSEDSGLRRLQFEKRTILQTTAKCHETFSAGNDLVRFMSLQGRESKRLKLRVAGNTVSILKPLEQNRASSTAVQPIGGVVSTELAANIQESLPSLWNGQPLKPRYFIASSAMLTQRSIVRAITRLSPSLDLVERNWMGKLPQQGVDLQGFDRRNILVQDEGDCILSPGLGVICTSLQKVKQMPLPGQGNKSFAKQRLEIVAPRHERLVVLVAMTTGKGFVEDLVEKDYETLVDLICFAASLEDDISIQVVGGDDDEMARWIIGLMESSLCPMTNSEEGMRLLQDETLWELFLRQAGMNAYAAQALLADLKAPDEHFDSSKASTEFCFGLPAFIFMSVQERLERFERLLGGRKLLLRTSALVDAQWPHHASPLTSNLTSRSI